jgi:dihydroorotate dehydrogenase/Pyruvate/2-oxoacid:ferredoxin oxidoreductase delta subunit
MAKNELTGLETTLAGVKMRAPIGVGSVGQPFIDLRRLTPEMHVDVLLKHVQAGAGFICLPGTTHVPEDVLAELLKKAKPFDYTRGLPGGRHMRIETPGFGLEGWYLATSLAFSPKGSARQFQWQTARIIEILRQEKPRDVPLIANVVGLGAFPETYVTTARACETAGVDLMEINVGCGAAAALEGAEESYSGDEFPLYIGGSLIGDRLDLVERITREVVRAVSIPVGVKVSPETGFPRIVELARRARDAGAKFLNCCHAATTIAPPDIYNGGKPKWPFMNGNPFVAGSGNWLRMISYKQVAAVAKFVPGIELVACGGLVTPEHMVEAMMLGARVTQTATGVMYGGRGLLRRSVKFLTSYMEEHGYRSVEDFIGSGLKYVIPVNKIDFQAGKVFACIDASKCTGCGRCTQHFCLATYLEDGVAKVRIEDCMGCGACVAVCPETAVILKNRT